MARHERGGAQPKRFWFAVIWTGFWGLLTLAVLIVAIPQWISHVPDSDAAVVIIAFTAAMAAGGLRVSLSVRETGPVALRFRSPDLSSIPSPDVRVEKNYRLPRPNSAARQPMRALAEAESALAELMRQLGESAVPADVVADAWHAATDVAARLRAVATRLEAVELAAKHGPAGDRATLDDGVANLRQHLDQGLDTYRALIGAAGRVVLAGTPLVASTELAEATESLTILAEILRELATPDG